MLSVAEFPLFTVAMFVRVPLADPLTSTVTVMKSVEFAGTVSPVHVTRLAFNVPPFDAETNDTCGGRSSVTVTPVASVRVALEMLMVYVMRSPWFAVARLSVLAIERFTEEVLEAEDDDTALDTEEDEAAEVLETLLEAADEVTLLIALDDKLLAIEADDALLIVLTLDMLLETDDAEEVDETIEDDDVAEEALLTDEETEELLTEDTGLLTEELEELDALDEKVSLLMKTTPEHLPDTTFTLPLSGVTRSCSHPPGTPSVTVCRPAGTLSKRRRPFAPLYPTCALPSRKKENCGTTGIWLPFTS